MEDYLIGIGKKIKEIRKNNNQTILTLAQEAEVSNGLISRIENGRTIPSLPVLLNIIQALKVEVPEFFNALPKQKQANFLVCKAADQTLIEKEEEAEGFVYKSILGKQFSSMGMEAVLLEIHPGSKRTAVVTDAYELKYMIAGECDYHIGEEKVSLSEGDCLFFDGRIPHLPSNISQSVAKMLVIYFYQEPAH
ncbi:cupin [Echinicola pacifica]|uniref:Cupin n=1 Tax=Echinicola pacifica TaxID=346377 RepID=A0A918PLA3_9BACT|nr:XRE family transcriptional regulator [Echinicola pacifica]GGZ14025.1 cupin [Echinicola pacifica]